ncbi:hypothetical protein ACFY00_19330 [Kitasatospora sp. NPDC001540]|uniref:hypothetical protein n=1 Tax=Kitasatospora sp. NPDC001540 TaxID=3364014 RepID=UPI00368B99CE
MGRMMWTTDAMHVAYCQYFLYGPELPDGWDAHALDRLFHGNGVAAGCPDHLTVLCGTHTGLIRLGVERCAQRPPEPGPEWESVVELSLHSSGELRLRAWDGVDVDGPGNLAHAGPGWYRVRVQTRGRDRGREADTAARPVEEHRLTLWPAPPAPDAVLRVGDLTGRRHHDPRRPAPQPIRPPAARRAA